MLILPTDPLFYETMMRFIRTLVPTLTIHRVHVAKREEKVLSLQIEMTDGSLMFVEAFHQYDKIEVVLEYGLQRVDLCLYANCPNQNGGSSSRITTSQFVPRSSKMLTNLKINSINKVAMNRVIS